MLKRDLRTAPHHTHNPHILEIQTPSRFPSLKIPTILNDYGKEFVQNPHIILNPNLFPGNMDHAVDRTRRAKQEIMDHFRIDASNYYLIRSATKKALENNYPTIFDWEAYALWDVRKIEQIMRILEAQFPILCQLGRPAWQFIYRCWSSGRTRAVQQSKTIPNIKDKAPPADAPPADASPDAPSPGAPPADAPPAGTSKKTWADVVGITNPQVSCCSFPIQVEVFVADHWKFARLLVQTDALSKTTVIIRVC